MTRYLLIALLIFSVGCDNFRWPDRRRGRGDRRRNNTFGLAKNANDPVEFWQPKSRIFLQSAVSQYSTGLRDFDSDIEASRLVLVEAGHLLQEFASPRDVIDSPRERHLCQNILFVQATVFAETNHTDEAFHALQAAERFGFADVERLKNAKSLASLQNDDRMKQLVERISVKEPAETMLCVESAFRGLPKAPFPISMIRKSDQMVLTTTDLESCNVLFMVGSWNPPCREMLPILEKAKEEFESEGVRFWILGIDAEPRHRDLPTVLDSLRKQDSPIEVLVGERLLCREFREVADFPATLLIDNNAKIIALLTGYHSIDALRGVVHTATSQVSKAPSY